MPSAPPQFGSQNYWNQRFAANSNPFEWLEEPNVLDSFITEALKDSEDEYPQLLHIGCGTSLLSLHLRTHVKQPSQVHNLDYSDVAIDLGRMWETGVFTRTSNGNAETGENTPIEAVGKSNGTLGSLDTNRFKSASKATDHTSDTSMRWAAVDLLNHSSVLKACVPAAYSIVVDKSTSDSIACSDDVAVTLPYPVATTSMSDKGTASLESSEPLHPLHVMAVHLALVTKAGARWISLSYSATRFDFLKRSGPETRKGTSVPAQSGGALQQVNSESGSETESDLDCIPDDVILGGFPNPNRLWTVVSQYEVETPSPTVTSHEHGTTHRPKVSHWVYIMERTETPLFVHN